MVDGRNLRLTMLQVPEGLTAPAALHEKVNRHDIKAVMVGRDDSETGCPSDEKGLRPSTPKF
jgi:hypothetical protein